MRMLQAKGAYHYFRRGPPVTVGADPVDGDLDPILRPEEPNRAGGLLDRDLLRHKSTPPLGARGVREAFGGSSRPGGSAGGAARGAPPRAPQAGTRSDPSHSSNPARSASRGSRSAQRLSCPGRGSAPPRWARRG